MNTTLDLHLAYKADTGYLPIRMDESSLRKFEWVFELESKSKPDNEEAWEIENEAKGTLDDARSWAEDLLKYVDWLENRLYETQQTLTLIQKYKLLKRTK